MSNISMVEAKLPPGFRFHPRDDELISDYLMNKVTTSTNHHLHHHHHHHETFDSPLLIEVDLNKCEPWDLPELACVGGKDWYFYSQRDRKYATGQRTNRATATGYWKATGKDRPIRRRDILVGMRKMLVFYRGRAPAGTKTDWVMHEFRLQEPNNFGDLKVSSTKEDWVLCRVFYKNKDALSKPAMESCYDHDTTMSSLSLPPLTHSYINFKNNQTGPNNNNNINGDYDDQQEQEQEQVQVPCFSIFNNSQTGPNNIFSSHDQFMNTTTMASDHVSFGGGGPMVEMSGGASNLDPSARDKRVIKAVLDKYFIKMESGNNIGGAMKLGSPTSFGEGDGSSQSFLSEMGMPNMY